MLALILLTIVVIGVAMMAMAAGTIFSNRCLRGSCGSPEVQGPDGRESMTCDNCPQRSGTRGHRDGHGERRGRR